MNSPQRITRHLVKAVSAGALLFAAALPAAVATNAGAATVPSLSGVTATTAGSAVTPTGTASTYQLVVSSTSPATATIQATAGTGTLAAGTYTITEASAKAFAPGTTDTFTLASPTIVTTGTTSITLNTAPAATTTAEVVTISIGATNYVPTIAGTFTASGSASTGLSLAASSGSVTIPAGSTVTGGTGIAAGTIVTAPVTVTTAATPVTTNLAPTGAVSGSPTVTAPAALTAFGAGGLSTGETIYVAGSGFAADGGNVTITSSNPDLAFTNITEISSSLVKATLSTTAATTSGYASITLKDNNGTSAALADALLVNPAPTISSVSPVSLANGQTTTVTVTGTGIDTSGDSMTFTNTTDGTTLKSAGVVSSTSTSAAVSVTALNSFNNGPASTGTYTITLTNSDGGSVTTGPIFSVTAAGISNVSPSQLAVSTTTNITISGAGFQPNTAANTLVLSCGGTATTTISNVVVVSPSTITATVATGAGTGLCDVTVNNPTLVLGGNQAQFTATGALGVGVPATAAATVTAATLTPSAAIVPGSTSTTPVTLSLVGSGFGSSSTVKFVYGATNLVDNAVTGSCTSATTGTTMTCAITVATTAVAGIHGVEVLTGGVASNVFPNALTVSGPSITSASPATVAMNASVGTVINLTGTGFNSTAVLSSAGALQGTFAVTSPTTATFALTTSPSSVGTSYLTISEYVAPGVQVSSQPFALSVTAAPTVTSLQNTLVSTVSASVGAGAVNVPVLITGTGFQTGATIGSFVSPYGVADPNVTATVKSINLGGNQLTALVTIKSGDANISDGYTITNPDGGYVKVAGFTAAALFINAGPTITSVSPATVLQNTTTLFTITGTGFVNSSVQPSANGTCGPTTVVSSTSLTVTCTFSAATATAASLVVTNADGGSATSATVLAAATAVKPPVVSNGMFTKVANGHALVGHTVIINILGGGFYGQPRITSNVPGVKAIVSRDSGKVLVVRVTIAATNTRARGWHTFTIRRADGKIARVNYLTK
ncbi:MAG: hypothetical protein HIU84_02405 [Acidobacteria bacterium]|nr:hypothetical protein [Acidobacteriota bacterium]